MILILFFLCCLISNQLSCAQDPIPSVTPNIVPSPPIPALPPVLIAPVPTPVAKPSAYPVELINGTDWQMIVGYTTPAGVATTDAVGSNYIKKIVAKDLNITYSLAKEQGKVKTANQPIPVDFIQRGVFQITPDTIKDAIKEFIETVPKVEVAIKK